MTVRSELYEEFLAAADELSFDGAGLELLKQHRDFLESSCIAADVARARGYRSIVDKKELVALGFSRAQARVPALLVPVWGVIGVAPVLHQCRPDHPRERGGRPVPYETAAGVASCLDVPPLVRPHLAEPSVPLWITEGARNADAAVSAGACCIALAGAWRSVGDPFQNQGWDAVALKDRTVLLAFNSDALDRDDARNCIERLRTVLASHGARPWVAHLPGDEDGVGLADYLGTGGTLEELQAEATPELEAPRQSSPSQTSPQKERPAVATQLVALAENAELFHTPGQEAYATVLVNEHQETFALNSRLAAGWLARTFHAQSKTAPSSAAIKDALNTLTARALYDGPERDVHNRVAEANGAIYVDLGDKAWRAVEIGAGGWRVVETAPVKFRRSPYALELPEPQQGGSLAELRVLLNIDDDDTWALIAGWLIGALSPQGPYPLLVLHGEQGSAKSTTARALRSLIDPNKAPLRAMSRDEHELMISASSNWCLAFDNLSRLDPWFSDALCRLSTGGGFGSRRLYSGDEELVFAAMRPVILNGIEELATRSDLLSRTILVELPRIAPAARVTEREFLAAFERARASTLAALYSALSVALRRRDEVSLAHKPRMADFAEFATAAEPGLGLEAGAFMQAYDESLAAGDRVALESEPVSAPLLELLTRGDFEGTASELLDKLEEVADERAKRLRRWPKNAKALSERLRRLSPNLRAMGIQIEHINHGRGDDKRKRWQIARPDQLWEMGEQRLEAQP